MSNTVPHLIDSVYKTKGELTPLGVVHAVSRGLTRGERDFHVKSRQILCCIRSYEAWCADVLNLIEKCADLGVVAIDVAGCAHGADEQYGPEVVTVFQEAAKRNIHRTVHAGESGGAKEVKRAIEEMHAERIGHGYRILRDEKEYQHFAIEKRIHFEACPFSSVMTGSVSIDWPSHPIKRWATDDINFSISTDDPTCFGNSMMSDLLLARDKVGLSEHQLWKCQLNAARSCFLAEDEKQALIKQIMAAEPKM